jgi:hypothetical protein
MLREQFCVSATAGGAKRLILNQAGEDINLEVDVVDGRPGSVVHVRGDIEKGQEIIAGLQTHLVNTFGLAN